METYAYDNLDRLTEITSGKIGQQGTTQTFSYFNNGNFNNNSNAGTYTYDFTKKHAVTQIEQTDNLISPAICAVTYNFFNQPTQIEESDTSTSLSSRRLELSYGANQQREKTEQYRNDTIEYKRRYNTKYFDYETDYTNDSTIVTRYYNYIYGDNGVVAMHIHTFKTSGNDTAGMDTTIMALLEEDGECECKGYILTDSLYAIWD